MMKEKGQFKKKFVKKIATIMMAAAMVVSGGFGVAPAADHSVSVYATDNAYQYLAVGQILELTIPITVTDDQGATDTKNLVITIIF